MSRPSNQELCKDFRKILTEGFYTATETGAIHVGDPDALAITKSWRGEVWKAFRELESRLCPLP